MTIFERIKDLATKKGVTIAKLERDCDFSNGFISHLNKSIKADKAQKIADYFGVSVEYITMGKVGDNGYYINEETAQVAQELFENKELRMLFDAAKDATPEDLLMVKDLLLRLKKE